MRGASPLGTRFARAWLAVRRFGWLLWPLHRVGGEVLTNDNIFTATALWVNDQAAANATYGHISAWDVSRVKEMAIYIYGQTRGLFYVRRTHPIM